ncbi:hypothetical protein HMPREF0043_01235 [Actinobaculum sp. oral taxon 183 str. F0552]|nr:hypothetical protein HMPREF0043_01235 [Actinobaculum sp. oral taxon 183 str. F0552]
MRRTAGLRPLPRLRSPRPADPRWDGPAVAASGTPPAFPPSTARAAGAPERKGLRGEGAERPRQRAAHTETGHDRTTTCS